MRLWLASVEKPACGTDGRGEARYGEDEDEHGCEPDAIGSPQLTHPKRVPGRPGRRLHPGRGCQVLDRKR